MRESLSLTSQIISGFSLVGNIYLLYIYYVCPIKGIKSYKYSFLLTALQNILLSLSMILVIPMPASSNFAFALVAIGPLRTHFFGQYLLVLHILVFLNSLLIVTNSFVFRYIHICKCVFSEMELRILENLHVFLIHLVDTYLSSYGVSLTLFINGAVCSEWLATSIIVLWPNPQTIERYATTVYAIVGVDPHESAQLCYSLENGLQDPIGLCLYAGTLVVLLSMMAVMVFATIQIKRTLRQPSVNENVTMHRRLLSLLFLQTACPILLLYMPCIVTIGFMFTGTQITPFSAFLFIIANCLYPLLNPLVIIGFLNEYREHTLKIFRLFRDRNELPS